MTSVLGEGTADEIRLPLTLAIMSALLVEAGGRPFGIPLQRVERTMRLDDNPVRSVAGQQDARPQGRGPAAAPGGRRVRRRRRRAPSDPDTHVVIVRGDRAQRRALGLQARSASASWSPARSRQRRPRGGGVGRRGALQRRHRAARRLRRPHQARPLRPGRADRVRARPPSDTCREVHEHVHRHAARRPARARQHRIRQRRHRARPDARQVRRHQRARRPPCCRWPRRSRSPARPTSCATASSCRSWATWTRSSCCSSPTPTRRTLCGIYGIEPSTPDGQSMLGEVGNILGHQLHQRAGADGRHACSSPRRRRSSRTCSARSCSRS